MKDTQILFSGPIALATLDETKSQTRRPVKCAIEIAAVGSADQWNRAKAHPLMLTPDVVLLDTAGRPFTIPCPYGRRGDRLRGGITRGIHSDGDFHNRCGWPFGLARLAKREPSSGSCTRPSSDTPPPHRAGNDLYPPCIDVCPIHNR